MNPLLINIRKFISTVIELYPLPFDLTTDLHTLNAYLKTYSESEELLLEGFVSRQVQKLNSKLKINDSKGSISVFNEELCDQYPSVKA